MKEELQTALADLISKTLQGVDKTKDFLTAEIPDVVNRLLMWHGVYSFILFAIAMLIVLVTLIINYKQYKYWTGLTGEQISKMGYDWRTSLDPQEAKLDWGMLALVQLLQFVWIIPFMVCFNLTWLQIWIAPKVWLIEYMGNLVK